MNILVVHEQAKVPVTVLRLKGNLTSAEELQSMAKDVFARGARNILIDLSEVPYVATAGLRAIHYIYVLLRTDAANESNEAVKRGIAAGTFSSPHLKLLKPNPKVLDVLKMAGYDMFLQIHSDYNQAVASFAPQ